jgi:hypothetical protein
MNRLCIALGLWMLAGCSKPHGSPRGLTLSDYAQKAKDRGAREARVPYASDEEEGEMLVVKSLEEALDEYQWIVGEPIEEKIFSFAQIGDSSEPDSIFTAYRFRIEKRLGTSRHPGQAGPIEERALRELRPQGNEILVIKSGGNLTVDGVLLKKRGSLCFSELMPRRYLLGLRVDATARTGWIVLGCRGIYSVDEDRLMPRQEAQEPVATGIQNRFKNSLSAFEKSFGTR